MHCPLCGAQNSHANEKCYFCEATLIPNAEAEGHIIVDTVELSNRWISRKKIMLLVAVLLALALPWILLVDLFGETEEVRLSRDRYKVLLESYEADKERWNHQKAQIIDKIRQHQKDEDVNKKIITFQELPLEVVIALMIEDFGFDPKKFNHVALYPKADADQPTLILSKYEHKMWPFRILVSLQISLECSDNGVWVEFQRMQRGTRDIAPGLAWVHFGPELQLLRKLEGIALGMKQFGFYENRDNTTTASAVSERLRWSYLDHNKLNTYVL